MCRGRISRTPNRMPRHSGCGSHMLGTKPSDVRPASGLVIGCRWRALRDCCNPTAFRIPAASACAAEFPATAGLGHYADTPRCVRRPTLALSFSPPNEGHIPATSQSPIWGDCCFCASTSLQKSRLSAKVNALAKSSACALS